MDKIIPTPQERKALREQARALQRGKSPQQDFIKSVEDFGSSKTIKARPGYAILSLDTNRTSFEHEEKEQEYQDLRKLLFDPKLKSKSDFDAQTIGSKSTGNRRKIREKSSTTNSTAITSVSRDSKGTTSNQNVSVKDFIQTGGLGLDHFQKHLMCVKKLAKRYRKSRRPHGIPGITVQVFDWVSRDLIRQCILLRKVFFLNLDVFFPYQYVLILLKMRLPIVNTIYKVIQIFHEMFYLFVVTITIISDIYSYIYLKMNFIYMDQLFC